MVDIARAVVTQVDRATIVKRFYFLEYFYVLLKSVEKYSDRDQVFEFFKDLKQKRRLGESKYRVNFDSDNLSRGQLDRYRYTFGQVISEADEYGLIIDGTDSCLYLTDKGRKLLAIYNPADCTDFNLFILRCMEESYQSFRHLVEFLYRNNKKTPGLLVFPNYSPRQLQFERSELITSGDFDIYASALVSRLEEDIRKHLGETKLLSAHSAQLLARLRETGLLPNDPKAAFDPRKYNVITKRFRDHWIAYFLNEVYGSQYSLSSFEMLAYRGKQVGVVYASDFYPGFAGRVVYSTSLVAKPPVSADFQKLHAYEDGVNLYAHWPPWERAQEMFVNSLVDAYFVLRRSHRSYFINLLSIRELVCYSLKIPEFLFERYLDRAYKLNITGDLRVKISLEVDKLPEETTAMYLKQEPVMVDGKYRNIIAIDVAEGARRNE